MSEAVPRSPAAPRESTMLDTFLAVLPWAMAALVILMILLWQAAVQKTPTIFTDEVEWTQLSRAIATTGHAARRGTPISFKSLYAFLIAPCWWLHSTLAAYTAIKYLNTIVMALAAIPTFLLARRLVSPRAAAIAGLGALCTSAFFYAPLILPEVLAYPTFCLCAYLSVRALSGDGWRWTVAAIVACAVAIEVRDELICAGGALALAAALLWLAGPTSKRLRRDWSRVDHAGAIILAIGLAIVLNQLATPHVSEWAEVTNGWKHRLWRLGFEAASALVIGLGILPAIAGLAALWLPERRLDPRWRAFAAFLAASIVTFGMYTAVKATFLSIHFGTYVEERNLIYLGPLLIVGAVVYFSARRPSLPVLAVSGVFCGWLVLGHGYQLGYPYFEAPGYGIAAMANRTFRWDQPTIRIWLAVSLAVAIAIALLPFLRRFAPLKIALLGLAALTVASWSLGGEVTSARGSAEGAQQLAAHLGQPFDWVDELTSGAGVTYLGQQIGTDDGLWLTEFWNRSIKNVWTLDGTAPGPGPTTTPDLVRPDGTLSNDPGLDYVLVDNGVRVIGDTVSSRGSLSLVHLRSHPWRLQETYYGRSSDSWIVQPSDATSADGTYAYFGPSKSGLLELEVSRGGFCAAGAPPSPVTVRIGPVALNEQRAAVVDHPTIVRHVLVHSCQTIHMKLHVRPPVAATVHVTSFVRPSDYGASDSRLLGVQFGASFTPDKKS
jgi:hypothetical protein